MTPPRHGRSRSLCGRGRRTFLWLLAIPVFLIVLDAIVFWMAQNGTISRIPAAFKLSDKSSILSYLLPLAWLATAINLAEAPRRCSGRFSGSSSSSASTTPSNCTRR